MNTRAPCALRTILAWLLLGSAAVPIPGLTQDHVPRAPRDVIVVGVRADARPFSYRSAIRANERILAGFGGYVVEVCRRVLSEMIVNGPFKGFEIEKRVVLTGERFGDLDARRVDMLCGPDSITLSRLFTYNASHPLFLSGVTYVSVADENFPRTRYCSAVVGLVQGTTAETEGLRKIAERGDLQLYDSALERYLALLSVHDKNLPDATPEERLQQFASALDAQLPPLSENDRPGRDRIDPKSVVTENCPNGFDAGPVVFYDSHRRGLEDLCDGKILFYVADVDIITKRLAAMPDCVTIVHRETLTREVYGVFFRRDRTRPKRSATNPRRFTDSMLYAEFNNVLLRKMQKQENILDYEFAAEFDEVQPTEDLKRFFDGYKFASDY